jgi:hypothetical protein
LFCAPKLCVHGAAQVLFVEKPVILVCESKYPARAIKRTRTEKIKRKEKKHDSEDMDNKKPNNNNEHTKNILDGESEGGRERGDTWHITWAEHEKINTLHLF